jgi:dTDP-4-amino-4,6-dideoxygalactose transaminase
LAEKLALAEVAGNLPKVVIPVHLCGQSCDMAGIHALGEKYGFKIIEDASHAIGGKYKDNPIGNCCYSDITVFSFHPVKIITTGEGGMAVTNNTSLAKHMRLLRSHGLTTTVADMQPRPANEIWNYQQIELGFNYRMTDMQAALGLSQMRRLDMFVSQRHDIAQNYLLKLIDIPLTVQRQHTDNFSSYHLYVIRLQLDKMDRTQRQVYDSLHSEKVLVNLHYIPVYRQPYYVKMGFPVGYCPEAEKYYSEALSIPMYSGLTMEQQEHVTTAIRRAVV